MPMAQAVSYASNSTSVEITPWHRAGRVIAELHEDERGVSGLALDPPQLAAIRGMAQAQEFDVLIVRDLSRISRSATICLAVEQELQRAGIQIACVTGGQTPTVTTKTSACPLCRR